MHQKTVIIIPARLGSTRLPGKPLADIGGKPMIVHVAERAQKTGIGPVYIACAEPEIAEIVAQAGFKPIITRKDHPSGTDRIFEALTIIDPNKEIANIINLQGDLPFIAIATIDQIYKMLSNPNCAVSTGAALINEIDQVTDPKIVKVVLSPYNANSGRALYFSRSPIPYNAPYYYHHIGVYGFKRQALEEFVGLPPSLLEKIEQLEQLRLLEHNRQIDVAIVKSVPISVDTAKDLEYARLIAINQTNF